MIPKSTGGFRHPCFCNSFVLLFCRRTCYTEIYKITEWEKEKLKDYSYTTEDVTQIKKQTWSIHPVKFPSETKLDKGEYVIVFGSNDDDSVDVELEFNVE